MEARSASASETQPKKHSETKKSAPNTIASEHIKQFICPVTTEILFEPVMISGCWHLVEGRIAGKLKQCPQCRGEEKARGITLVAAPPVLTSILSATLAADPTLWRQVYLDENYLEEVLRKNELKTPTGERFIKLLENNKKKKLNEKALAPKGVQSKSVIEILASYPAGRELLRKNEKIRILVSDETKQSIINNKTIAEWLAMEKEEPEATPTAAVKTPVSSGGLFASSSAPASSAIRAAQPLQSQPADTVWQRVVYGNEDGALQMLRANPRLVEQKATVTNYSGIEIDNATPYQAAIRQGDDVMAEKIKAIYLEFNPENGQAILDAQFNEIFPDGYAAHLEAQNQSANDFECDYVNPLVDAMTNASRADLQTALDKRDNGSLLCRELNSFKAAFTALSHREKVFNPFRLQKAFEKYNAKFDAWYVNEENPNGWLRLDLFWRQAIGWEERYMTTNYAQSFCTGIVNMVDNNQPLRRVLNLRNYDTYRDINFFPLDTNPSSRLGSDFGVYSYGGAVGTPGGHGLRHGTRIALQDLCRAKTANLGNLRSPSGGIAHRIRA